MGRISGPLWDRFDLVVEVPPVPVAELADAAAGESSAAVRARVEAARAHQRARHGAGDDEAFPPNARLPVAELPGISSLPRDAGEYLRAAAAKLSLSARGVHRVLRVARTIADLAAEEEISAPRVAEALQYRRRLER
jgi:magnesium chelatase family protein